MEQGFTKPARNASGWDQDLNADLTLIERGHVFPAACGPTFIASGQPITFNSSGFAVAYNAANSVHTRAPDGFAYQVVSPGNIGYFIMRGSMGNFGPYSGQFSPRDQIYPSINTPGWVTNCLDNGALFSLGRCIDTASNQFTFDPQPIPVHRVTEVQCGFANAASAIAGVVGVFSFAFLHAGNFGVCDQLRVRPKSCDNYRVSLYANSARSDLIYDTVVLSGNLSVRTNDMIDAALFQYHNTDVASPYLIYGQIQVLSSAATAINSDVFRVDGSFMRTR